MSQYYHGHYHALRNRLSLNTQVVAANARGEDRTLTPFCGQGILSPSIPEVSPEQTAIKGQAHPAYVHGSALASQKPLPRTLPQSPVRSFRVPPKIKKDQGQLHQGKTENDQLQEPQTRINGY